jgi:hypothetical protein
MLDISRTARDFALDCLAGPRLLAPIHESRGPVGAPAAVTTEMRTDKEAFRTLGM